MDKGVALRDTQQILRDNHVSGRRHWQELSQSLYDRDDNSFYPSHSARSLSFGLLTTAYIIDTKPIRHTSGATLMRRALKMSASYAVSVDPDQQETDDDNCHPHSQQDVVHFVKCKISLIHNYITLNWAKPVEP